MTERVRVAVLGVVAALLFSPSVWAADPDSCQTVRFSDVGWTDITSTTAATSVVLKALGYEPTASVLSVPVTYTSLKNGDIDVFLGNWMPTMEADIAPYREDGSVETLSMNLTGAKYTLAVNKAAADGGIGSFGDIAGHRDARAVVTLAILAGTVSWVYVTLLPVMTREVFDGDARLLGTLSAAIGIGQVPSAVLLAFYRNFRHTGIAYIASMLTLGLAIVGYAVSTSVPLTLGLLALTGLTFSSQHIMLNAILLRIVEPRFHGRVLGAMFLPWGFNVLGLLSAGAIAEALGVQLAVGLSGALLVIFASGAVLLRPQLLRI